MEKVVGFTRRDFLKRTILSIGGFGLVPTFCNADAYLKKTPLKYNFDNLFPRYENLYKRNMMEQD